MPTFHEYAEQWFVLHKDEVGAGTLDDRRWRLEKHLLPFFAEIPLDAISFDTVERYIAAKLSVAKPLAPRSLNMTLTLLATILDSAVERDLIVRNPAKGKRRRVREHAPARTYLDRADQIRALLDAAGRLDSEARADRQHVHRKAIVATLVFAGLRIGELVSLRWRDVDLAAARLTVGKSKTDAGRRRVAIRGALHDELARIRPADADPDSFVFGTPSGAPTGIENVRNRVLAPAVKSASAALVAADRPPLPDGLTPHSMRRTFASVLYALGEDPRLVMTEMGHAHPGLALQIYAKEMSREPGEIAALRALVDGGASEPATPPAPPQPERRRSRRSATRRNPLRTP